MMVGKHSFNLKVNTYILVLLFICISCSSDDDNNCEVIQQNCDAFAEVLPDDEFDALTTTGFGITEVSLDEDCLIVTIGDSGCNPDNWDMSLYSTNAFNTGSPTVRAVKVDLINNEACLAVFEKTMSFDLLPFQLENQNEIMLAIDGWAAQISYQY